MLADLKIGTRLTLAFAVVLFLLLSNGILSMMMIRNLSNDVGTLATDRMPKIETAQNIIDNVNIAARALRNIYIDSRQETQTAELKRIADSREVISSNIQQLQQTVKSEKGKQILAEVVEARSRYTEQVDGYIEKASKGQLDAAREMLLTTVREVQKSYFSAVQNLITYQLDTAKETAKTAKDSAARSQMLTIGVLIAACIISTILGIFIIRSITGPVQKTVALAKSLAQGDLTVKLDVSQKDEIGVMAGSMNATVTQLRGLIGQIIMDIKNLSSSSADLASVSRQLSSSAIETAQKSGTVASAAEEMSTNIQSV